MSEATHTELYREQDNDINLQVRLVRWSETSSFIGDTHTVFILERWDNGKVEWIPIKQELWEGETHTLIRRAIVRFDESRQRLEDLKELDEVEA